MSPTPLTQEHSAANLAAPFLELLPISGVSILVINEGGHQSTIYSSDETSARLDEIQFDLGQGPAIDAFHSGQMQQTADVSTDERTDWLLFFGAVSDLPVAGIVAVPLLMGAACVGVAVCHGSLPRPFDQYEQDTAAALGRAVAGPALRTAIRLAQRDGAPEDGPPIELRRDVHQATGMVLAQLDVSATEAFVRMRAYAFSSGLGLRVIAGQVLSRQLDFSALPE